MKGSLVTSQLVHDLVASIAVKQQEEMLKRIEETQTRTISARLRRLSLKKYTKLSPRADLSYSGHSYRSGRINRKDFKEHLYFDGERLIIDGSPTDSPIKSWRLPKLKELYTQVLFLEFPKVQELGLFLSKPIDAAVLSKIPTSVKALRIFVLK